MSSAHHRACSSSWGQCLMAHGIYGPSSQDAFESLLLFPPSNLPKAQVLSNMETHPDAYQDKH